MMIHYPRGSMEFRHLLANSVEKTPWDTKEETEEGNREGGGGGACFCLKMAGLGSDKVLIGKRICEAR